MARHQTIHERCRETRRLIRAFRAEAARLEGNLLSIVPGERLPGVYLKVRAADFEALVSAERVEEVLPPVSLDPIEMERQGHLVATFTYQGEALPAFDLASLLGEPRPVSDRSRVMVIGGGRPFGLLVDSVALLESAPVALAVEPSPPEAPAPVRVEVMCESGVLPLLDVPALVAAAGDQASESCPAALAVLRLRRELLWRFGLALPGRLQERLAAHLGRLCRETGAPPATGLPPILAGREGVVPLLEAAVTGEGYFMRHPDQFALLRRLVASRDPGLRAFRAWSAGCGAGEEPYSLAMTMLRAGASPDGVPILATDSSARSLEHARAGRFGRWSFRGADAELRAFFAGGGGLAEVAPAVRRLVEFRLHDLALEDPPEGDLDLILCRNVLSLLDPSLARRVGKNLVRALRPGGWLLLGESEEEIGQSLPAERVSRRGATLLRRAWGRSAGRTRSRSGLSASGRSRTRTGRDSDRARRAVQAP
ncbi:MAG TPA: CheR family methyltransferase [Anaeromyxobacteraceae bacterium]|nr:CheR family methyltransferase [Anaeromyxobacteraceae bacterium]